MHPSISLVVFLFALVGPWWPSCWVVRKFIHSLRVKAKVDKAMLDALRKMQREQVERGETVPLTRQIEDDDYFDLPSHVTGIFERYFAFVLVLAFGSQQAVATVLIAWIGAKLLANWQRQEGNGNAYQAQIIRSHTLIALIAGTLSVSLGVAFGVLARHSGSAFAHLFGIGSMLGHSLANS